MKNIDVTKSVMDRVVLLEESRTHRWIRKFRTIIGVLMVLLGVFIWRVWVLVSERHTLDLLTLFREDREIIAEFWQETVITFIEELPQRLLVIVLLVIVLILAVFLMTRKRRAVINRKLAELEKQHKSVQNKR